MQDPLLETPLHERTISAVLDRHARDRPNKVAIIEDGGRSVTYGELQTEAFRIAASLSAVGARRQETVAVMLDNHVDAALVMTGTLVSGAIMAPINTAYKGGILRHVLGNSGARVAVVEASYLDRIAAVADELPDLQTVIVHGEAGDGSLSPRIQVLEIAVLFSQPPVRPEAETKVWEIAALIYTSGTTGHSKGVLSPHGHIFTMATTLPTTADDVMLVSLPLFHGGGLLAQFYGALRSGATAVFLPAFSASSFFDDVRRFGITVTALFGAMIPFLSNLPARPDDADNPLKFAAVVPAPPDLPTFSRRFGIDCVAFYGQTETGTTFFAESGDVRPFVIGRPRPHVEVRLVDENDTEVAPGETGEIVVRSREPWSMMTGYLNMPEATVKVWRNLWLHTGDAAHQDESGVYVFVDRVKDALRRRGENVSSLEVEGVIAGRLDVAQVAIVAVPSEYTEDEIKAVIVLKDGFEPDPEEMLRDLVERLPYFMVPRYYEFVAALPLTPTQKVQKAELRDAGVTEGTWDCEGAGLRVTRHGIKEVAQR